MAPTENLCRHVDFSKMLILQIRDSSDVDILCLQEIFRVDIQQEIYESLLAAYPYIHSAVNLSAPLQPQPACAETELQQYDACVQMECPLTDPTALLVCVAARYLLLLLLQQNSF